jgi:hypothetical protein
MTETPGVDSALQPVAFVKQGAIRRTEIVNDFAQADPKHIGLDTGAQRDFISDQSIEFIVDL